MTGPRAVDGEALDLRRGADGISRPAPDPFPGLRAFEPSEADLFFGRATEIDAAVRTLAAQNFVVIVGRSGVGKSSLVQAGIIPAWCGRVGPDGHRTWSTIYTRPGLTNLARNLVFQDRQFAGDPQRVQDLVSRLREGRASLAQLLDEAAAADHRSRLLVVDAFEEIWGPGTDPQPLAECFIEHLLSIRDLPPGRVAAVLVLRSDFVGECDRFPKLADSLNTGIRMLPRMSVEQLSEAITRPLARVGERIEPDLVERLIEDAKDLTDQLCLMQHALRSSRAAAIEHGASAGALLLTRREYEFVGGLAGSLNFSADAMVAALSPDRQQLAESLFRSLTTRDPHGYLFRRASTVRELAEIARRPLEEVMAVTDVFRREGFLMPPISFALSSETVLDVSHEAILRNWHRLTAWIDDEAELERAYQRHRYIGLQWAHGQAALYTGLDVEFAKRFVANPRVHAAWAQRFGSAEEFAIVQRFLNASIIADSERGGTSRQAARREKVFVSYRRQDSGHAAWDIYSRLEEGLGKGRVFFDVSSVPAGADFRRDIEGNIQKSAVLIAVIGDHWLDTKHDSGPREGERRLDDPGDYVRFEIERALGIGIRVIPVLVGAQQMPTKEQLPPALAELAERNAVTLPFGPEFQARCNQLIAEIQAELPRQTLAAKAASWFQTVLRSGNRSQGRNAADA